MKRRLRESLFSLELLKRLLIYGILILFLGCAQCAFFPFLSFCPMTPDLVLALLVAIALLDSESSAAVCAVCAGFFVDSIGASGVVLSPLIYFFTMLIISLLTGKILKSFPSFLLLLVPALLCRALGTLACMLLNELSMPPLWVLWEIILPEAVYTAICALPIYFLIKLCTKPLKTHSKFTF